MAPRRCRHLPDAVVAHVFQKQIAKDDVCDAGLLGIGHRNGHFLLVDIVGAWKGNMHDDGWQAGGIELHPQQFFTHAVHADAAERFGDGGQAADDFVIAGATRFVFGRIALRSGARMSLLPESWHCAQCCE